MIAAGIGMMLRSFKDLAPPSGPPAAK
jgi:hypothetical protein